MNKINVRKLPIGIQNFEDLRKNGYLYVDKTQYIWNMAEYGKPYFLSRPRRFGKSLLVSTMEAYFQGKKELFKGLSIEKLENQRGDEAWLEYPVISFYLSGGSYTEEKGLADRLNKTLEDCIERYKLVESGYSIRGETLPVRFQSVLERLYEKTGRQVVVLVDEYDKPLLEAQTGNSKQEEKNRQLYKDFFSVLKDEDRYLKFVFFTGVTKFSKVSIFSDLNHLTDITLNNSYSEICGITENELLTCFEPEIQALSQEQEESREECLKHLARQYDGYHFSAKSEGVYNPYSLLNAFAAKDYGSYWFETGTPTFLIHKLQHSSLTAEQFTDGVTATETELKDYRAEDPNPIPLFYQSGYLTITGFDRRFREYSLGFPNEEVKYGFLESLVPYVLGYKDEENPLSRKNMILDLEEGDIESFIIRLRSVFASIPYQGGTAANYEEYWRNQTFLILEMLGAHTLCEVHSFKGRCDCVVKTMRFIYVFEFKIDRSAVEALNQIEEKGYSIKYEADRRTVVKVGINFSSETRNIADWKCVSQ